VFNVHKIFQRSNAKTAINYLNILSFYLRQSRDREATQAANSQQHATDAAAGKSPLPMAPYPFPLPTTR
jgi:hypothetical protein